MFAENVTIDKLYRGLSPDVAQKNMNELQSIVDSFLEKSVLEREDIEYNDALLMKIIIRIDQRSDYFTYFHSTIKENGEIVVDKMSQFKQIALLCYWIIKYKPFRIKEHNKEFNYYSQNYCTINEALAAYIFISQVNSSKLINKEQKKYYHSKAYIEDVFYKFMHHDISKEAMIFSLCSTVCNK